MIFETTAGQLVRLIAPMVPITQHTKDGERPHPDITVICDKDVEVRAEGHDISGTNRLSANIIEQGRISVHGSDCLRLAKVYQSGEPIRVEVRHTTPPNDYCGDLYICRVADPDEYVAMVCRLFRGFRENLGQATLSMSAFLCCVRLATTIVGTHRVHRQLTNWVVRVSPNGWRAVAGNGAAFWVQEFQSAKQICDGDFNLYVPPGLPLSSILDKTDCDEITVTNTNVDGRLVTTFRVANAEIITQHANLSYPNEEKFLHRNSIYFVTVALNKELRSKLAGSANLEKRNEIVRTTLTFDFTARSLSFLTTAEGKTSAHSVPLLDFQVPLNTTTMMIDVANGLLQNVPLFGRKHKYVQWEILDPSKPIVCRYSDSPLVQEAVWTRDTVAMTRERKVFFFAPLKRKE